MIKESYTSNEFKMGTAGFILEDGTFLYADMYNDYVHGGFSKEFLDNFYPEFSNTHAEDDTCVRVYKNPNEIQYKKLEEIIDTYLDLEGYCKIEVWGTSPDDRNPHLYEVCSLFEGACEDYREEEIVGNWTGYKLIQKIKAYFSQNENMLPYTIVGYGSINTRKDSAYDLSSAKERALKMLSDKFVKSVSIFNHDNLVWTKRNSAYESLNEAKKGPIVDEKILNYFYECVDRLYELKFWDNDFCLHYELIKLEYGEYINTFGEYQWPNEPKGEGTIVLNIHMFDEPEEAIKNTIYHELAHYIVFKWGLQKGIYKNVSWGKWTYSEEASKYSKRDWTSHGKVWQSVADKIGRAVGIKISRVDSFNTHTGVGAYAEQSYKYIFKCKHCGNEFKYSKRTQFVDSVLKNKGHSPTWWCCCKDGFKSHDFEILKSE